jgi:hypothetical protein
MREKQFYKTLSTVKINHLIFNKNKKMKKLWVKTFPKGQPVLSI